MFNKVRRRVLPLLIVLVSLFAVSTPKAEAASGVITYVRFDWYKQTNGTYNINIVYCLDADRHALYWGENSPGDWDLLQTYQYQNGCVTRLLFTQVLINDYMYARLETNYVVGDSAAEAGFSLARTGASTFTCTLNSTYRNGLQPVSGRTCAWTL